MKWTAWSGMIGGVVLNLLAGLLLVGVMPLEYWSYEHGVHGSLWEFGPGLRWGYEATGPSLRDLYLSGFIHLGG